MNYPISSAIAVNLLSEIGILPEDWSYIPADGKKAPLGDRWQQNALSKNELTTTLTSDFLPNSLQWKGKPISTNRVKAVGALCGSMSGGLLFLDHDGDSCDETITQLSGHSLEDALPDAPMITSGRQGRYQLVYRIPQRYWGSISTKKIKTGVKGENGKPEMLEFRWDGCQSIVAGQHPETGKYTWVTLPSQGIPEAPGWMIEQMITEHRPNTREAHSDEEWAQDYLKSIPSTDEYDEWVKVGQALHSVSDSLLWDWDKWSSDAQNYEAGMCEKKWKTFSYNPGKGLSIGYLGMLAKQNGWERPSFPKSDNVIPINGRPDTTHKLTELSPEDKYTKFRQEIMLALKIQDKDQRDFTLEELAIKYRRSKKFIDRVVKNLLERDRPNQKILFTGNELMAEEQKPTRYLIEDMVPQGESILLSAKPKVGKTLLAYAAAYSVLSGEKFLNRFNAKRGRVLIVQTEEGKETIKERLIGKGFDTQDGDNYRILTKFRFDHDLAFFESQLAEFRPSLVIVDSVRRINAGSGRSENDPEFAQPVYQLSDVTRDYGASMIIIHHDNKSSDKDSIDNVSGTSALPGAVWGIWRMVRTSTNENDPSRHLACVVRGEPGSRHHLRHVEQEGCQWNWEWQSEVNADPALPEWEKRIMNILHANKHRELSMRDIKELIGLENSDKVLNRPMNRLQKRGRVKRRRDDNRKNLFWYSFPNFEEDTPPTLPPPVSATQPQNNGSNDHAVRDTSGHTLPEKVVTPQNSAPTCNHFVPSTSVSVDQENKNNKTQGEIEGSQQVVAASVTTSDGGCDHLKPIQDKMGTPLPSDRGGEGTQSPFTEKDGVVQYRTDAKPRMPHRTKGVALERMATINDVVRYGTSGREYWVAEILPDGRVVIDSEVCQLTVDMGDIQLTGRRRIDDPEE